MRLWLAPASDAASVVNPRGDQRPGKKKTARNKISNTDDITITGSLAEHLLGARPVPGAYTPSRLLGADLVTRLPGCGPLQIT